MEASALYRGFYERNPVDKKLLANFILVLLELDEDAEAAQLFEELKTLDEESDEAKKVADAIKKEADELAAQNEESENSDTDDSAS